MIRPFTVVCMLFAAGSGLYLYQTKQRTLTLDHQIGEVLKSTAAARARTTVLRAEYADLSRPDRLLTLSQKFLRLRPTTPGQFVEPADLDSRLPPVETFPKPGEINLPAAPPPLAMVATNAVPADPVLPPASLTAAPTPLRVPATPPPALPVALHPVGAHRVAPVGIRHITPPRPRITEATYNAPAPSRAAPPTRAAPIATPALGGSMLGGSANNDLAPPVPAAN